MVKCALACKFKYPALPSSIHFLTGTERAASRLKYPGNMGTWMTPPQF